ncbi:hypothetical protein M2164_000195 [Streptomyces sp. SAI-208]|nr:hypothetical protein [Streptomyces sp. SAI-208]
MPSTSSTNASTSACSVLHRSAAPKTRRRAGPLRRETPPQTPSRRRPEVPAFCHPFTNGHRCSSPPTPRARGRRLSACADPPASGTSSPKPTCVRPQLAGSSSPPAATSSSPLWADPDHADRLKQMLETLHRQKIDLADEVLIVNPGGYIGDSTDSRLTTPSASASPSARPIRRERLTAADKGPWPPATEARALFESSRSEVRISDLTGDGDGGFRQPLRKIVLVQRPEPEKPVQGRRLGKYLPLSRPWTLQLRQVFRICHGQGAPVTGSV